MAVLQDNSGGGQAYHLFNLGDAPTPPKGTFRAKIIDIVDKFGVERKKFDNPSETEKVDLTAFLFGFRDRTGAAHKIDSRPMKISGNEKSNLYQFLKSLTGESPKMGWDYMDLKGRDVLITIEHAVSKQGDKTYAQIAAVSPIPEGMDAAPAVPAPQPAAPRAPARPAAKPTPPPAPVEYPEAGDPLPF